MRARAAMAWDGMRMRPDRSPEAYALIIVCGPIVMRVFVIDPHDGRMGRDRPTKRGAPPISLANADAESQADGAVVGQSPRDRWPPTALGIGAGPYGHCRMKQAKGDGQDRQRKAAKG